MGELLKLCAQVMAALDEDLKGGQGLEVRLRERRGVGDEPRAEA
jgi:hypothetical protein